MRRWGGSVFSLSGVWDADGGIDLSELMEKIRDGVDLVVISQVMFMTGQIVHGLDAAC